MEHDQLDFDLKNSPAVWLLNSDNRALVLSFLHQHFKQQQPVTIPLMELTSQLDLYLDSLKEQHPGRYPQSATTYLKMWSDEKHKIIRIYAQGLNSEDVVQLTPDTERVIGWIESMSHQAFIGTESRFLQIFALLEEIVAKSTTDVETRLIQLERDKARIQKEIDQIVETGQTNPFTPTQLKERFIQANDVARQLVSDFSAVEQNFRSLARTVQEAQLQPDARKGAMIESVLDADERLKDSDEGRSFYAFWQFLMSPIKQEELGILLDAAYSLSDLHDVTQERGLLRNVTRYLLDWGEKIVLSNQRLAEQVRRLLDERNIAEMRRVRELIKEIQQLAFQRVDESSEIEDFIHIEGDPEIQMMMERGFWQPPEVVQFDTRPLQNADTSLNAADLLPLYNPYYIDESILRRNIDRILSDRPQATLTELVSKFPIEKGLAELLGYLVLATKDERHRIDTRQIEKIYIRTVGDGEGYLINVPHTVFRKGIS